MLRSNPLQPPRPFSIPEGAIGTSGRTAGFVSPEDYDRTGILTGVDPCESQYWWMPELYGPETAAVDQGSANQATNRPLTRSPAAA